MTRKELFETELLKAQKDYDVSLSQPGVNWAWAKFGNGCDKAEEKTCFTEELFNKEAPAYARLIILESIKLDNGAKREVFK